jgi:hypothetical protein
VGFPQNRIIGQNAALIFVWSVVRHLDPKLNGGAEQPGTMGKVSARHPG